MPLSARITTLLLILVLATGITIVAMLATRVHGGPLDPPGTLGSTQQQLIFQPSGACPAGFPITISTRGSYRLAQNITGCPNTDGIVITTGDVTLDLAGFTVTNGGGLPFGIKTNCAAACHAVVVRNGALEGWGSALFFDANTTSSSASSISATTAAHTGFSLNSNNHLSDCVAIDSAVFLESFSTMEHCSIRSSAAGIFAWVEMDGDGSVARNNDIKISNGEAMFTAGLLDNISDNDIVCSYTGTTGIGLSFGTNSDVVRGNRIAQCDVGINMDTGARANVITENILSANGQGLVAGAGGSTDAVNIIARNVATANGNGQNNFTLSATANDNAPKQSAATNTNPSANINN